MLNFASKHRGKIYEGNFHKKTILANISKLAATLDAVREKKEAENA